MEYENGKILSIGEKFVWMVSRIYSTKIMLVFRSEDDLDILLEENIIWKPNVWFLKTYIRFLLKRSNCLTVYCYRKKMEFSWILRRHSDIYTSPLECLIVIRLKSYRNAFPIISLQIVWIEQIETCKMAYRMHFLCTHIFYTNKLPHITWHTFIVDISQEN